MRSLLLLLIPLTLLAACSRGDEEDAAAEAKQDVVGYDDSESGNPVRITSKDGKSVSLGQRDGNEAQWPRGFAPYPGATVTSDIAMGSGARAGKIIGFTAPDAPDRIASFYRRQAETAGFEVQVEMKVDSGRMVTGTKSDGTGFSIHAAEREDGSNATLTVGATR